jgi:hypothetical protein
MKKVILLNCYIFLSCLAANAQITPVDTGDAKIIIIENDNASENRPGFKRNTPSYNNLIRWNMLELAKGVIGFGYERRITNWVSADFVLGYTTRDYLGNIFVEEFDEDYDGGYSYAQDSYKVNGGVAFMIGARIYPGENDDFDGFYIAPHVYLKSYNYDRSIEAMVSSNNGSTYTTIVQAMPITQKVTDLGVRFGWQRETGIDGFFYDFNIGFGNRKTVYDQIVAIQEPSSSGGSDVTTGFTTREAETSTLVILMGFNFGFAF